jgi:poly(3-hydroxybutyrate) depolymerase
MAVAEQVRLDAIFQRVSRVTVSGSLAQKILVLAVAGMAILAAAGAASATELRRISVNGEQRTYRLYLPPSLKTAPVPIVIALHGAVQTAAEFETDFGMNRIARRERFAVAYPEGINRVWDDARPPVMRLGYVGHYQGRVYYSHSRL